MSTNIGVIEGTLRLKDVFSSVLNRVSSQVAQSTQRINSQFGSIVNSTRKYESEQRRLISELQKGTITHKQYTEQLKKTREEYDKGTLGIRKFTSDLEASGKKLQSVGSTLTKSITLPLLGLAAVSIKSSNDINRSLANVSALLTDLTGDELNQVVGSMKSQVQSLAIEVGKSTSDISGGLYEVISALGRTDDTFVQLEISAKSAAAGLATTQESFNFLSAVTKTYGDTSAEAFKKVADLGFQAVNFGQTTFPELANSIGGVAPLAKLAGVSLEEMFAVLATATGVTGNTNEVVTQMSSAINGLLNPSKDLKAAFKAIGVESGQALIAEKGFVHGLQLIAEFAEKTKTPMIELLGRKEGFVLTASLAGAQAEKFAQNLDAMGKAAGANGKVVQDAFDKQTNGINKAGFAWDQLKVKIEVLGQKVGDALIPVFLDFLGVLTPLIEKVASLFSKFTELPKPLRIVVGGFIGLTAAIGPLLFVFGQLMQSFAAFVAFAPKVVAAIASINFAFAGLLIVIAAVGLGINALINDYKRLQDEATQAALASVDLEGRALAVVKSLSESPGRRISISAFQAATKDLQALDKQLDESRKKIESLSKSPVMIKVGDDLVVNQRRSKGLLEEEKNLKSVTSARDRLKRSLQSANIVYAENTEEVKKNAEASLDLGQIDEDLAKKIADLVSQLREQIIQEKIRGAAIGLGEEAEKAAARAIAIRVAVTGLGIAADSALGAEVRKLAGALFDLKDANDQATDAQERLAKQANLARQQWANAFTASVEDITRSREEYEEQIRISIETGQDMADEFRRRASERLEIQREVDSFTRGPFQDALARAVEWHDDFIAKINDAEKRAVITAEEAADAILASEVRLADERVQIIKEKNRQLVSDIGVAIDYLADQFGGLFNYLSDLIQSIQQAQGLGQSVSGIATGFGASASSAGMLGTAVTVIGVWKAIYDMGMDILRTNKSKKFGQAGGVVIEDGFTRRTTSPGVGQVSSEAIRAIQDVIKSFEEAFRLSIDDLSEIGIKLRNDGKKIRAYVAGVFIGEFNDTMEAIEAAFASALTNGLVGLGRVSDLFKEGLNNLPKTKDLDSVIDFLSKIKEIDELGLSQGALALREATFDFDKLWDALEKFKVVTPAVTKAFNDLIASEARLWQDWLDSITGRQKSAAEIRQDKIQELAIFKIELALRRALITQRVLEVEASILAIKAGRTLIGGTGGGGTSGGILGVAKAFSVAGEVVAATAGVVIASSVVLSEAALAMLEALEAEKAALLELRGLLDGLKMPDVKDIKIPKSGGGKGDEVGDFIRDKTRELGLAGLSDYLRAVAEINNLYDEQLEKAGKDIKQREKLLDLKEQELALLAKEQKDSVVDRFRDFLGLVTPFDQVRETAEDLIKSINESPFGDARKAQMVSRVLEEIERQLDRLSQEMARGMFNDLASQLEAIGADELQIAELRRLALVLEHQMNVANHRANLEILRAEERVSQQVLDTIDAAIRTLEGYNPAHGGATPPSQPGTMGVPSNEIVISGGNRWKWDGTQWLNLGPVPGQGGSGGFRDWWADQGGDTTNQLDDFNKKLQDAIKSLEAMEREALDPLTRDILDLQDRFAPIFETLGDNVEYAGRVQAVYAAQLEFIMRRHFGAINDLIEDAPTSAESPLKTIEKFNLTQSKFFDTVNAIIAGDFSKLGDIPTIYQDLVGLLGEVSPKGSDRYRVQFDLFRSMLEQLGVMGGFDPDRVRDLSSGSGFGNLLVPKFDITSSSLLDPVRSAQISDNVVHIIGAHSDRQHLQLQETNSRLLSIEEETRRVRRSIGELAERKIV